MAHFIVCNNAHHFICNFSLFPQMGMTCEEDAVFRRARCEFVCSALNNISVWIAVHPSIQSS